MSLANARDASPAKAEWTGNGRSEVLRRVTGVGPQELARETRGAVFVEYITLLCCVTFLAITGFIKLGVPLLNFYRYALMILAAPFP